MSLLLLFGGFTAYTLQADAGSYALSGQAAGLRATRVLAVGAGAYTLSGQAAGLNKGFLLQLGAGSYVLTGQAATLTKSRIFIAEVGSYTLSGQAVGLKATRLLTPEAAAYALTGWPITFRRQITTTLSVTAASAISLGLSSTVSGSAGNELTGQITGAGLTKTLTDQIT